MQYRNLIQLLEERAKNNKAQLNFLQRSGVVEKYSYEQILSKSKLLAQQLNGLGLVDGATVGILLGTSADFLIAFFGIQLAGCIPVAIAPPRSLGSIEDWQKTANQQFEVGKVKCLLTDNQGLLLGDMGLPFGSYSVSELLNQKGNLEFKPQKIHHLAFLQFTSGTTGFAKAVAISHENVLANARGILDSFHSDCSIHKELGCCVSWLPLYHDMGLVGALFSGILSNIDLVLIKPEHFIGNPYCWLKAISDFKATITLAPNFAYGLCSRKLSEAQLKTLDLSSLEVALCGAEMLHPQTISEFKNRFVPQGLNPNVISPVYGLAEATLAVTFSETNSPIEWIEFDKNSLSEGQKVKVSQNGMPLASVGYPLPQTKIEIRNDLGVPQTEGFVGSIWIQSPSIMQGYYHQDKLTSEIKMNGWLNTGDLGFIFNKKLFIAGRKKEVIILRGQNHDPSLVERSLMNFVELREGCAVAFSSMIGPSIDSENLYVVAELKKDLKLSKKDEIHLCKKIADKISADSSLSVCRIELFSSGTLPRTSSGKIKRKLTKELWESNRLGINKSLLRNLKSVVYVIKLKLNFFTRNKVSYKVKNVKNKDERII